LCPPPETDPFETLATRRYGADQSRPRSFSTKLFRQIHLLEERLVAGVIRQVLEQGLADVFDERTVLVLVCALEPLT
jgi:hypothetical protein